LSVSFIFSDLDGLTFFPHVYSPVVCEEDDGDESEDPIQARRVDEGGDVVERHWRQTKVCQHVALVTVQVELGAVDEASHQICRDR